MSIVGADHTDDNVEMKQGQEHSPSATSASLGMQTERNYIKRLAMFPVSHVNSRRLRGCLDFSLLGELIEFGVNLNY